MNESSQVYYLEVVTPEVDTVCESYSKSLGVSFSDPVAELGGARTTELIGGGKLGVRAPMHESEEATTRPYYLVENIEEAVEKASSKGATVAVPPMEIPGHGICAVLMIGPIQSGLWQL